MQRVATRLRCSIKCSHTKSGLSCLSALDEADAIGVILQCLNEVRGMNPREKKDYMSKKIAGCINGYTNRNYTKANWKLGFGRRSFSGVKCYLIIYFYQTNVMACIGVCRACFHQAYECGHSYVDVICSEIKKGICTSAAPQLNDNTAAYEYSDYFKRALNRMANSNKKFLDWEKVAAIQIPNTIQSLSCYAWMNSYFKLTGDFQPNSEEIHLEPITIKEIFEEVSDIVCIIITIY